MAGNGSWSRFCIVIVLSPMHGSSCGWIVIVWCTVIVVFFIYNMHTDWSCWSRSATKVDQKGAFFFSSISEAYRHSMASSNRIQDIQNLSAQYSWKYMKVKPNEPTITVTVNTCQMYALKLASIGHFSAQRCTTIRIEQSTMNKDFLRGLHKYEI